MREAVAEDDVGLALEFHEALGQLSRTEMEAIELIKVEGLSLAEAARRIGVHAGTLKVRVHRAYARLKNSILR
jgi:RNA polymerase sigma-70 factor (ECF subfamily)